MGGIAAPSLYAAFGSKDQLFREAIQLYNDTYGARLFQALDGAGSAREGVEAMLRAALDVTCRRRGARGCLVVLSESGRSVGRTPMRRSAARRQNAVRGVPRRGQTASVPILVRSEHLADVAAPTDRAAAAAVAAARFLHELRGRRCAVVRSW